MPENLIQQMERVRPLKLAEAARYLGISTWTMRRKIRLGEVTPDGRVGKSPRFRLESLDRYMEGGK